ncbi:MAG: hypothetical protein IKT99_03540 [Oscillospiraceae bacterium]|nr:hypothetical protein [Oscillospiraceae bacterium]
MDKKIVFRTDLMHMASATDEAIAELALPAMPFELRDAVERAHLDDGEPMYIDITDYTEFPFLEPYLEDANDLYALNALAEKLAAMEPWQIDAFEGLLLMEGGKPEPPTHPQIYDLAASAGECQVLYDVRNDEELGRFYVDDGFVPETEDLPETLYPLLDYRKIGEKMRKGEGGVFLRHGTGYVTQVGDLKEEFKDLDLTPWEPDYSVLLEIAVPDTDLEVLISLPCRKEELSSLPGRLNVNGWSELTWRCADCRIPALRDAFSVTDNIPFINLAARQLAELPDEDVIKLKGLVNILPAGSLEDAVSLMDHLGEYEMMDCRSPGEMAEYILKDNLSEGDIALLLPHLDCESYTKAVIQQSGAELTPYGLLYRSDGLPVIRQEQKQCQPEYSGMEMT